MKKNVPNSILIGLLLLVVPPSIVTGPPAGNSCLEAVEPGLERQQHAKPDQPSGDRVLVRIKTPGLTAPYTSRALNMGFHLATEVPPVRGFFDLAVPRERLPELSAEGWEYEVRKEGIPMQSPGLNGIRSPELQIPPEYHTYEEMTRELDSLYQAYPEIAFMESLGVSTLDQRVIWGFKVSDNVEIDEDEPAVLYVSTHHGCEMIGMEYCLYLIGYLLANYGVDPQVTRWVDETEIWFVPLFNPDGYWAVYTDLNHEWRKNARDTNNNGIYYEFTDTSWSADHDGVDLNRNYSFNWALGGSGDPWNYHYRGEYPFSEDENKSMYELATREKFQMAITFHSWGEVVIYPWETDWNGEFSPDIPVISAIADTVGNRIPTEDRTDTYYPYPGSATEGYIDNWIYADLGTICMTLEVNPYPLFIEPGDSIIPICERLFNGTTYLLDRVHTAGVTGVVTDDQTGLPLSAEVRVLEYYADYLSPRTSDATGRYYRSLLPNALYSLEFIAQGYDTVMIYGVYTHPESLTTVNVAMTPTVGTGGGEGRESSPLPTSLKLGQNYPNPFNPSTTISFDVPDIEDSRQTVALMIFDLRGRRIKTLVDSKLAPGGHSVLWDGRDDRGEPVTSGIYLYSLRARGKTYTRKMTVLK